MFYMIKLSYEINYTNFLHVKDDLREGNTPDEQRTY